MMIDVHHLCIILSGDSDGGPLVEAPHRRRREHRRRPHHGGESVQGNADIRLPRRHETSAQHRRSLAEEISEQHQARVQQSLSG